MSANNENNSAATEQENELIAKVMFEMLRRWNELHGDNSGIKWKHLNEASRQLFRSEVRLRIEDPRIDSRALHEHTLKELGDDGWRYGPVFDTEKKEAPLMVPYDQLPAELRAANRVVDACFLACMEK